MDTQPLSQEQLAKGLGILATIPVVLFALWGDYFVRGFVASLEDHQPVNRANELDKVRLVAFCILLFQVSLFLGSHTVRQAHSLFWSCYFGLALLFQGYIQSGIERRLSKDLVEYQEKLNLKIKTFLASCAFSGIYFSIVIMFTFVAFSISKTIGLSSAFGTAVTLVGILTGIICAMAVQNFLTPFQIRLAYPVRKLADSEDSKPTIEAIHSCFTVSGLKLPKIWVLELKHFQNINMIVTGFKPFQANLFLSAQILDVLSVSETKALLFHEISHILLNHSKKKLYYTSGLIVGFISLCCFVTFLSYYLSSEKVFAELIAILSASISTVFIIQQTFLQNRFQELEADIYAIERLGADLTQYCQALHKIDRLQFEDKSSLSCNVYELINPRTRRRIELLQRYFSTSTASKDIHKAA